MDVRMSNKAIWVTNGNHMGPILDLARMAHVQPVYGELISDLILHIHVFDGVFLRDGM